MTQLTDNKKEPLDTFIEESKQRIQEYKNNSKLNNSAKEFQYEFVKAKYAYNFFWMGVPIIQVPQDLQVLQEIIWDVKPDLIIETGVAWGGSVVFSASMLALLEGTQKITGGQVIGIDIDIRPHNRENLEKHELSSKITLLEGSSIAPEIVDKVKHMAQGKKVLLCLDSNHTHEHVLAELNHYAPLVAVGSYIMVGDTGVEGLEPDALFERPWGRGNSPKSAIDEFLKTNDNFIIDRSIDTKIMITSSPDGFLKRIK